MNVLPSKREPQEEHTSSSSSSNSTTPSTSTPSPPQDVPEAMVPETRSGPVMETTGVGEEDGKAVKVEVSGFFDVPSEIEARPKNEKRAAISILNQSRRDPSERNVEMVQFSRSCLSGTRTYVPTYVHTSWANKLPSAQPYTVPSIVQCTHTSTLHRNVHSPIVYVLWPHGVDHSELSALLFCCALQIRKLPARFKMLSSESCRRHNFNVPPMPRWPQNWPGGSLILTPPVSYRITRCDHVWLGMVAGLGCKALRSLTCRSTPLHSGLGS